MRAIMVALGIALLIIGCASEPQNEPGDTPSTESPDLTGEIIQSLQQCGSGLFCYTSSTGGATQCLSGSQVLFCCPSGFSRAGGSCLPNCPSGRSCGLSSVPGASLCSQSFSNGNQTPGFCCAAGRTYTSTGCR
jgi:hypothetical protein